MQNLGPFGPGEQWHRLLSGLSTVVDAGYSGTTHYAIMRDIAAVDRRARLSSSQSSILNRVVLGESQKAIAIERGVTESSIALCLRRAKQKLGFEQRLVSIPAALVMAAYAHQGYSPCAAEVFRISWRGEPSTALCARVPAPSGTKRLTPSELVVLNGVVAGLSREMIAHERGREARTVHNQIGAIFRKFGVSGRLELIRALVREAAATTGEEARIVAGGVGSLFVQVDTREAWVDERVVDAAEGVAQQ